MTFQIAHMNRYTHVFTFDAMILFIFRCHRVQFQVHSFRLITSKNT